MSSVATSATTGAGSDGALRSGRAVIATLAALTQGQRWMLGGVAVAFVALFFPLIDRQIGVGGFSWQFPEDWGHAYVVPIISGYFVWKHHDRILRLPVKPFWPGLVVMLLAAVCYVYFIVGYSNHMFQGAALILALAGVIMLTLGAEVFRFMIFPLAYLGFAITISDRIMLRVTWGLKILASHGSEFFLALVGPLFGLDVQRTGNILRVFHGGQEHPLNVADACSGMRMVIAFIALSVAVACFSCQQWWQRVMVVLLAVPVALLMNVLRVGVLGLLTIHDPELAVGGAHAMVGTLLLIPGFGLFMACVWAVKKITPNDEPMNFMGATS